MADELESIAEVEAETPIETEVEQEEALIEVEGEETEKAEPVDDEEEFEWNGKKVKGPKGLKDSVSMHADYTRKTQEIAATRKELEERATRISQQAKASEEEISARAELHAVSKELERFKDFGWPEYQAMRQSDPMGADEAWNYIQHLRGQQQAHSAKVSEAESKRSSEAQQDLAKRMNETQEYARSKGYTEETDKQIIEFATKQGLSTAVLRDVMNPQVYEILRLASVGLQLVQKSTAKPVVPKAPIAPLVTVTAKTNPPVRKTLNEMSVAEHAAYFAKQKAAGQVR